MAVTSTLRPFRDYDEHEVINLFRWSGSIPAYKGTIVEGCGNGWLPSDELQLLGSVGASYDDVVSERYGVAAHARACTSGSLNPMGMLLHDVKEEDENGEKLKYNPRKAAEMEVALSGQAVPIVTRGTFLYSGSTLASDGPVAGSKLYISSDGSLTTTLTANEKVVGHALGGVDSTSNGVLIRLEL